MEKELYEIRSSCWIKNDVHLMWVLSCLWLLVLNCWCCFCCSFNIYLRKSFLNCLLPNHCMLIVMSLISPVSNCWIYLQCSLFCKKLCACVSAWVCFYVACISKSVVVCVWCLRKHCVYAVCCVYFAHTRVLTDTTRSHTRTQHTFKQTCPRV